LGFGFWALVFGLNFYEFLWQHIEARAGVTALTIGKITFAESANVVVASPTANAARLRMFDGDGRSNLSRLRRAGNDRVAFVATYALPRSVIGVRKNGFKNRSRGLCPAVRRELVTYTARADITFRRVTGVAIGVRADSDRNRLRRAARLMTPRTALLRSSAAAVVSRVIEFHIKAFFKLRRKGIHRRRRLFQILVAHHADTRFGICKFGQMTSDARIVSGKS
jgi:hypothetical protein